MKVNDLYKMPTSLEDFTENTVMFHIYGSERFADHKQRNCYYTVTLRSYKGDIYKVITLTSYDTIVCYVIEDMNYNRWIAYTGTYSVTTAKHITWFLRLFTKIQLANLKGLATSKIYPLN